MARTAEAAEYEPWRMGALGLLTLLVLVPVTLPVPVLRDLVAARFGVSETLTSLFMSINMFGAVLAAPFAGALADRVGRRPLLIASALAVDAVCFLGLAAPVPFWAFLAIRFVEGCAHIFALSLLLSLASTATPPAHRGRAMGLAGGGLLLGVAIGAPIGGVIGRTDPLRPLTVGAAILAVALVLALLTLRETGREAAARPGFREMRAVIGSHRRLLLPLLFAFADRFTVGFYTTTFSLYLKRIHELPPPQIGMLIASFMLPFALFSVPFGRLAERGSLAFLLCGGSLLYGLGTACMGFAGPPWLWVLMPAVGITAAVMFVPSLVMTTEFAPESLRSTAIGAFNAAGSLGFIVGPLVGGLVSEGIAGVADWETGYASAFALAGASEVLLAVLAFPALRRIERTMRPA